MIAWDKNGSIFIYSANHTLSALTDKRVTRGQNPRPVSRSGCVSVLTTNATPAESPSSGGQGLRAANAMRYAAKTPPPTERTPSPEGDLG